MRRTHAIYFISTDDVPDYPVKIGIARRSVPDRLSSLQIGNPHLLVCLATFLGTPDDEAKMHAQFAASRLRGEWFARSPELLKHIRYLRLITPLPKDGIAWDPGWSGFNRPKPERRDRP